MKKFLLSASLLLLIGAGCLTAPAPAPAPTPAPPIQAPPPVVDDGASAKLGEAFSLNVGETRKVQGGLQVTLESIGDSRCKPGVQCIWAGELSPMLLLKLTQDVPASATLTLGTTTKKEGDAVGFHVALKDATAETATVVITQ